MSMGSRLGKVVTYRQELPLIKPLDLLTHVVSQDHVTNKNYYISTATVPMATKLGRVVIYHKGLLPVKSHYLLVTRPCEITWQTEAIISPLTMSINNKLERMVTGSGLTHSTGSIS